MGDVVIVGKLGCHDALPTGPAGTVLTVGADGAPTWLANAGSALVDFCALTDADVTCLVRALDVTQLTPMQVTTLGELLRGEPVTDVFGVNLGYLLVE